MHQWCCWILPEQVRSECQQAFFYGAINYTDMFEDDRETVSGQMMLMDAPCVECSAQPLCRKHADSASTRLVQVGLANGAKSGKPK